MYADNKYELRLIGDGWITNFLVSQPEKGMGYQEIDIQLKNEDVVETIALNCSVICLPSEYKDVTENDIRKIRVLDGGICNNPNP